MTGRSTTTASAVVRGPRACAWAVLAMVALFGSAATSSAQPNPYNSMELSWTASGDDGDVGQVSAYEIRYSTTSPGSDLAGWWSGVQPAGTVSLFTGLAPAGQTETTTITGLAQGTTYYFVIVAFDEVTNRSDYSNIAVGTTQSCGAPTETPGAFAAAADTNQVLVSWTPATDPSAQSLQLYRSTGMTGAWGFLQSLAPGSGSYIDTAVQPGVTYRYRAAFAAAPVSGMACEGPTTSPVSATLPGLPGGVADPSVASIHAYPNPSSGAVNISINVGTAGARAVRLRLFDLTGRWIATVAEGDYGPGTTVANWNREGRDGRRVAPGYYELLGTIGGLKVRERILLLP